MSYMIPDPTKQTSCKNCIFAIFEGNTQTGCEHGRIEKFGELKIDAFDNQKEFFVINRLCNAFRINGWNNNVKDIDKARKESCLSFDLLIDVNDINKDNYPVIMSTLKEIDYPSNKYRLIFFHDNTIDYQNKKWIKNLYQLFEKSTISVYFNKSEYLQSFIGKSKSSFHVILNSDNINSVTNFINKLEYLVNDDLKRFVVCKNNDKIAISNMACRTLYPSLYMNYKKEMENLVSSAKKQNLYFEF